MKNWTIIWAMLLGAAAVIVPADGADNNTEEKVLIRPQYKIGRTLVYNLNLTGVSAWTPSSEGLGWGKANTDFTFGLRAKTLRDNGSCTMELLGENLVSTAEGPKGKLEITATRERIKLKANGRTLTSRDNNPLVREMTVTAGPRGEYRFGTGLVDLAVYLLPNLDKGFWTLLTIAPANPVGVGDTWEDEFDLPVPGGEGRPLKVHGKWKVVGWETYREQKVLAITLAAELELNASDLILKNGDRAQQATGTYKAEGKVLWDVGRGVLCSAAAQQKMFVKADTPTPRALRSEAKCAMQLLKAQEP